MMMMFNGTGKLYAILLIGTMLLGSLAHSMEGAAPETAAVAAARDMDVQEAVIGSLQEARAAQSEPQREESYQRVYEAFTKLIQNVSNNSLGNARRLVSRLNQLVGNAESTTAASSSATTSAPGLVVETGWSRLQANEQQRTEQILQRLDQVNKQTDQHTLRQLQEDVDRLVGTLSESYLRNIRRVIERVNKTIGSSSQPISPPAASSDALHQSGDRYDQLGADGVRQPGFPGWDELIVAVDRMQKSLANFVRSSTKLITAGR